MRGSVAVAALFAIVTTAYADETSNRAKATLKRMRSIATAIDAYQTDYGKAPEVASMSALTPLLQPTYIRELPLTDGWETPFRYVRLGARSFRLVSAGADRKFDEKSWMTKLESVDYSLDAVYQDGSFVRVWIDELGDPLGDSAVVNAATNALVQSEMEKMKGMTSEESFAYFRTSSTQRSMFALSLFLETYRMKNGTYPRAKNVRELESILFPEYASAVPMRDSFGNDLRYIVSADGKSYRLVSAGQNGVFDEASWSTKGTLTREDEDAVMMNGEFIREWGDRPRPVPRIEEPKVEEAPAPRTLEDFVSAAEREPKNAERHFAVGVVIYESLKTAQPAQKADIIRRALAALDRAEALRPEYFESLVYRNLLLRESAKLENNPAKQKKLFEEADTVRARAKDIMEKRRQ